MEVKRSPYESSLAVIALLLLIQYFFLSEEGWFKVCILGFTFLILLSKPLARFVATAWEYLTRAIGWVMSKILLSVVFFLILTPIALLYRFFSKKNTNSASSYFIKRDHIFTAKDMESPW